MSADQIYLSDAVVALGDRHACPKPISWLARTEAMIAGHALDQQVALLGEAIFQAALDQAENRGPPEIEWKAARRRFNEIYEAWMRERLPSTCKERKAS